MKLLAGDGKTLEEVPEPDEITNDGNIVWRGDSGTVFPMTGKVSDGPWEIYRYLEPEKKITRTQKLFNWLRGKL